MKKRIYVYIKGVIFNVLVVAYLLGNLNERFLQKQKRDKERKRNKCMYKTYRFRIFLYWTSCPKE